MVSISNLKKVTPLIEELEKIEDIISNYHKIANNLLNSDNILKISLEVTTTSVVDTGDSSKEENMVKRLKSRLEDLGVGTPVVDKKKENLKKMTAELDEGTSLRIVSILIEDITKRKEEILKELKIYNII